MKRIVFLVFLVFSSLLVSADGGMWVPLFLDSYNIEDMQQKGFKLSAEDIYGANQASMKDAVMIFGGGCTGELVSDKGLLFTNYHCGYSNIQKHSSIQNDYLTDGFWAGSQEGELSNPGLTVTFLVYMEDVSQRVLPVFTESMTIEKRETKIDSVCNVIEQEIEKENQGKYEADVVSFFYGNQYIVMVTEVFKDVRLVGAPPSAIGKFGGDTDNWVWPRHTGDFSIFRIYADENNQPAEYSPDNVPYKPKKYFSINISGVKEGDFTMIFGYPGRTQEYIPSYTVENIINLENPDRIKLRQAKLNIIDKAMNADKHTRIQYSAKQSRISNAWKKWIGQNIGLKRVGIINEKQQYEKIFQTWANEKSNSQYSGLLNDYDKLEKQLKDYQQAYYYFIECIYYADIWQIYNSVFAKLNTISKTEDFDEIKRLKNEAIESIDNLLKNYNSEIDEEIFTQMMLYYFEDIQEQFYPSFYIKIQTDFDGDITNFVHNLYETSIFTDSERLKEFISLYYNGNSKYQRKNKETAIYTKVDLLKDPYLVLLEDFKSIYNWKVMPKYGKMVGKRDSLNHLYMQAQMKMEPNKVFYPDANSTLRVGYGSVKGFKPRDGIIYDYYTTLEGVIEKDDPEIYDYDVPDKLKALYQAKDYGRYADENGKLHVCFIGDNHTTGGNSGSPVLNANGELIGINFDRCWESTMSDIKFDPDYCRNIMLDIRYVLFMIDKYAEADYLLEEMDIIE